MRFDDQRRGVEFRASFVELSPFRRSPDVTNRFAPLMRLRTLTDGKSLSELGIRPLQSPLNSVAREDEPRPAYHRAREP